MTDTGNSSTGNRLRAMLVLSLILFWVALAPVPSHGASADQDITPCEDPRYVELSGKPLEEMSEREFDFFMLKDSACDDYRRQLLQDRLIALTEKADQSQKHENHSSPVGIVLAFGVIVYAALVAPWNSDD